jgi:glucose-6-phosphate 1-dehydrogenase
LIALTAMEPPIDFTADSVRNEKVKVLKAIHTPGPKHVVRGQYGPGYIEGRRCPATARRGRRPDSMTETFVAAKLFVDNWRWADTPFYVAAGKRLPRRETTIAIQFKRAPHPPFEERGGGAAPNVLLVHIQPDEGVSLAIGAKVPGQGCRSGPCTWTSSTAAPSAPTLPEAYERLLVDCMRGDASLFTREDEVIEQWKIVDAIVAPWRRDRPSFPNYAAGTWGPPSSDELLHETGVRGVGTDNGLGDRAHARSAARRRQRRPPANERDDAHRLGAGGVGRGGGGRPRGARRAPSVAHDRALSARQAARAWRGRWSPIPSR